MKRALLAVAVVIATLPLGGCPAMPVVGGAALGAIATKVSTDALDVQKDAKLADTATTDTLTAVKPLNEALCYVEPWKPHSAKAVAAIKAFCANLPSDPKELWDQTVAVYKAVKSADAQAAP